MGNTLTLYHNTLHQYPSATLCGPTAIGIHRDRDAIGMHREGQRCSVLCGPTGIGMHRVGGTEMQAETGREVRGTLFLPASALPSFKTTETPEIIP